MRFERRGEMCVFASKMFNEKTYSFADLAIFFGMLMAPFTAKFPVWDEGVTRRHDVLEQAEPSEADQQPPGWLKQQVEFRRSPLRLRDPLQGAWIVGFRASQSLNPIGAGSFAVIEFGMSVHTGLTL